MNRFLQLFQDLNIVWIFLLTACASGGGDPSEGGSEGPPKEYDFSAVVPVIDAFPVSDMAVMIGDSSGVLFSYEKGDFTVDTPVLIASANKWLTGATIWRLIEQGVLSREVRPHQFVDFWTNDAADPRSMITLDMLLGLSSGFNNSPIQKECIGNPLYSLYDCVRVLYEGGVDTQPGEVYSYGPEHFQMAAFVASEAMAGQSFQAIMDEELFAPLGMSSATSYASKNNDNARYSGGIHSTAADYSKFLRALLAGDAFNDLNGFIEDRTANTVFNYRPDGVEENGLDWHYAFGFWIECDSVPFDPECNNKPTVSSPGAFGFTPWVDLERGYWGVIAFEGGGESSFRPSFESVALEQELQQLLNVVFE